MPTLLTHTFIAGAACNSFAKEKLPWRYWGIAVLCSNIPDADVLGLNFGISYGAFFGHRGFFHSIFFALLVAFLAVLILVRDCRLFSEKWWRSVLFFCIIGSSHGILDAFTDGGLGIALLSPFTSERFFFSWTPIPVSPIGLRSFIHYGGLQVIIWEILFICLPLLTVIFIYRAIRNTLLKADRSKITRQQ
jgi:inner membrane protein